MIIAHYENALICDLAETYHILNYRALPAKLLATLCCGLRDNSRVKMQSASINEISNEVILISIADTLRLIKYQLFGGQEQPKMLSDLIMEKRENIRVPDKERDMVRDRILEEARVRMEGQNG